MERVHSMFSNAFNTPAGQLVEKATSSALTAEEWGLNMQVCDTVNSYSEGSKDAVKAIKRRLTSNKNFNQISLTLSVLEACVKNCGSQFHILITSREFCTDTLMKVISTKNNPPVILQQRVLGLIKQLAETFGSKPNMSGVRQVYDDLKERGYDFPETTSLEGILNKNDPSAHGIAAERSHQHHQHQQPRSMAHAAPGHQRAPVSQTINPNPEQITKLHKDIGIVVGNIKVFSEMLTELNPLVCDASDYELLQELNRTCRSMQQRIVELIEQVGNEEITIELLRVNDDLNNVFLRYDRFEKYRANKETAVKSTDESTITQTNHDFIPTGAGPAVHSSFPPMLSAMEEPPPSYSDTEQPTPEVNDLIDLSAEAPTTVAPAAIPPQQTTNDFLSNNLDDMSLENRMVAKPAAYPMLSEQLASFDQTPDEIERLGSSEREIEQWLSTEGSSLGEPPTSSTQQNAVTDEFSAFLNERATAAVNLPDISASSIQNTNGNH